MKTLPYSKENISFARSLRKNMTKEERHLWYDFFTDVSSEIFINNDELVIILPISIAKKQGSSLN